MKCPLTYMAALSKPEEYSLKAAECRTTECAWFDEHTGVCSVLSLARLLTATGNVLGKIHDKIPSRIQLLK